MKKKIVAHRMVMEKSAQGGLYETAEAKPVNMKVNNIQEVRDTLDNMVNYSPKSTKLIPEGKYRFWWGARPYSHEVKRTI